MGLEYNGAAVIFDIASDYNIVMRKNQNGYYMNDNDIKNTVGATIEYDRSTNKCRFCFATNVDQLNIDKELTKKIQTIQAKYGGNIEFWKTMPNE